MAGASPLELHRSPAAGFDDPFAMLAGCHERVGRMLALLERLAGHLTAHGADGPAADAARDVTRYFDLAAPLHHEDEERHVLPRLREAGLAALADRLQADHAEMAVAWAGLRADLARVQAGEHCDTAAWPAFVARYRSHLAAEDASAFPAAAQAADAAARAAMGAEMARRRGL